MTRIMIADTHAIVRRGLRAVLREQPDLHVVGEADSLPSLLATPREQAWDVLLVDLPKPGLTGLVALEEVHKRCPSRPVVVMCAQREDHLAIRVLRAGGAGFLAKTCAADDLVQAIRRVRNGGRFVSPSIAEKLATALESNFAPLPVEQLSNREFEVLCLIAAGRTTSAIAEDLDLSVKTVSTYRAHVLKKMNMHSNADLVAYAIHHHLIHLGELEATPDQTPASWPA